MEAFDVLKHEILDIWITKKLILQKLSIIVVNFELKMNQRRKFRTKTDSNEEVLN